MQENTLLDKKSLKVVQGKTANWKELAKDCVAFANGKGGTILIGIEDDADDCPIGQRVDDEIIDNINKKIPQLTIGVAIVAEKVCNYVGDEFINLRIIRNAKTLACTTDGKYFIRIADNCKPIHPDQMSRVLADKDAFNWELVRHSRLSLEDVDIVKRNEFINQIRKSERVSEFVKQKSDEELLEYYFLVDEGKLTNLGVLWIGKRQDRARIHYAPSVQFIKYDEEGKKVNKYVWDDYSLNPKEIMLEIINLSEWKESIEISDGLFRKNIPNYHIDVIRELVVNALVHRIYTMNGDIFINMYHDKLEIHSPGLLPLGVTPQNIISKSEYRNTQLAKLFYDLKLMEKEGSGYDAVYEILLFNGKQEPLVEEVDDRVIVTVKKAVISKEVVKLMSKVHEQIHLTQREIIALGIIAQNNSISGINLKDKLSIRNDEVLATWLKKLLKNDVVLKKGRTKATEYYINPKLLKELDFKGQTDLKKIENHRLQHLIIEDLMIYQPCSIADINQRIGSEINQKKIKRLLDKMILEGEVIKEGQHRWTKYKLVISDKN
ncbi:ATP-binding protein [Pasteurella atlantica]|uniref:ATP-binding protein n=1 Tax=Pasteurellaceae TaxID=712 RepID=UPI00276C77CC|nr:ATP-binding protein [Pasteurella atlantica]MDP8034043.1 ATP-binding protein [Pasteurella atlantica]MDP8035926.1 ATP-binding protein [Pasteurella atlantica]MDP8037876.1 ATP-binding protein [Pasteurella atlantica]MDP8048228.1 ATP-binding protein [Pasteurella atlantica]MDP8049983.1 ATP-binding protein [Pasteurella atlantica]